MLARVMSYLPSIESVTPYLPSMPSISLPRFSFLRSESNPPTASSMAITMAKGITLTSEALMAALVKEAQAYDRVQRELKEMDVYLSETQIQAMVSELGRTIQQHYQGEKNLVTLHMMHGATYFAVDLRRAMKRAGLDFKEDAIRLTRYDGMQGGEVKIEYLPQANTLAGRKVLIIEDLIDKGPTMKATIATLVELGVKREDIKVAAFLNKPNARIPECKDVQPDFCCHTMKKSEWVAGYGCDQDELGRGLAEMRVFTKDAQERCGYGQPSKL